MTPPPVWSTPAIRPGCGCARSGCSSSPRPTRPARSDHAMVYDSAQDRVIMFGGRKEADVVRQRFAVLNDTWAWKNGEWQELAPAAAPPAALRPRPRLRSRPRSRDSLRRLQLLDRRQEQLEPRFDTWEFDGDNWTRVSESGPEVAKPLLVFDAARHETIMLGVDTTEFDDGDVPLGQRRFELEERHPGDAAALRERGVSSSTRRTTSAPARRRRPLHRPGVPSKRRSNGTATTWTKLATNSTARARSDPAMRVRHDGWAGRALRRTRDASSRRPIR